MFDTLLIANRGEIACRVAATARRMGLRTVAVYSDADADARHVAACDTAVRIGGPEPRASYLRAEAIVEAARQTGAQAVHPGYGFLSENEAFAEACAQAGIVFVGPPTGAIAAMGSKSAAKTLMGKASVPLVPGYHGDNQDPAFLQEQADAMGYPVLIKASAGGGGKGMRVVTDSAAFGEALASCKRESASSFGDDKVLIERYLQKPRHIEIQVFADTHGNCVYLFERDCSVQRRHQKVIEEAPAPGMSPERRRAMGEAAVAAARAVGYVGAGTVEFIVEPDGRFYFMEMNTRLQVEHPVTEMITGHDLVEWQLRVAAGEPLPVTQEQLQIHGHAIEARIYAENPDKGFLPSVGTLTALNFPTHAAFRNGDVRVDGGVAAGDTISPYYDPMIAKLIVHGADRDQALARMIQALGATQCVGVTTNIAFLRRLAGDAAFAAADLDTGLIERRHDSLLPPPAAAPQAALALAAAAVLAAQGLESSSPRHRVVHADPWAQADGWRLGGAYRQQVQLLDAGTTRNVNLVHNQGQWHLACDDGGAEHALQWRLQGPAASGQYRLDLQLDERRLHGTVIVRGEQLQVYVDGNAHALQLHDPLRHAQDEGAEQLGGLTAPMPGKIIAINVKQGDAVKAGDALLVMEAMKMEHTIHAPGDGTVQELFYAVGDQVADGAELIALE
ncbi:acetyl/propionyl/methylcrotonyl-CoA carboxylase subunit alpha [Candidimonas nitroreducens]|uniref:3-methylcrotonyl-CoA carboxylase n=1 Tax=Candidimonas nitroreducens TaxID=683354 RepID=A0A225MVC3_9BURK|nr:acetyl/propionyl/methylcrotonyl-CoA carboxylase subunit alpha [Candidimonas nitroreducens]OWT63770.1 3-methylcrotonyl-CoA carboxylase [Candidimonas nitroreducens]